MTDKKITELVQRAKNDINSATKIVEEINGNKHKENADNIAKAQSDVNDLMDALFETLSDVDDINSA